MGAPDETPSSLPGSVRRPLFVYGGVTLLLWLVRGLFVLSLCDVFFYGEELAKGAAGQAILAGIDLAHVKRGYLYYEGGGFAVSHLDALAFALVGPNLLALKLVALGFASAVLLAGMRLADQLFGLRAALFFGLLFVFAPSSFQRLSLLALGIHFEALLFVALLLWLTARLLAAPTLRASQVAWLGLVAGCGCFFSYSCALAVAYCGVTLLVRRPRETLRALPVGSAAFALGFTPWLWTYAHVGSEIFDIHGQRLLEGEERGVGALVREHLHAVWASGVPEALAFALLAVGFLAALAIATRRSTGAARAPLLWLGLFVILYLVVYASTGLAEQRLDLFFHVKRLSQPWLVATLVGAALLARAVESPAAWSRKLAWVFLASWLAAGMWGSADVLRAGRFGEWSANWERLRSVRGYSWTAYLKNVEPRLEGDWREHLRRLAPLGEGESGHFDSVLAAQLLRAHFGAIDLEQLAAEVPAERRDSFLRGSGAWWQRTHGRDPSVQQRALSALPESWRAPVSHAMGRQALATFVNPHTVARAIEVARRHALDDDFVRGVGYRLPVSLGGDFGSGSGLARIMRPLVFHPGLCARISGAPESRIVDLLREGFAQAMRDRSLR